MVYVDGYVLPVPKKNIIAYRKMALQAGKIWKKHGAILYIESVDDDLKSKFSGIKFPKTVQAKKGEKIVFSFVLFKSKTHRDRVNAKVMKEFMEYWDMLHNPAEGGNERAWLRDRWFLYKRNAEDVKDVAWPKECVVKERRKGACIFHSCEGLPERIENMHIPNSRFHKGLAC